MTAVFAIVGDPVAQVRSPEVFNRLFRERGIDAVMVPLHVPGDGLAAALAGLRAVANLRGVVVTVPHKPAAAEMLRSATRRVLMAGAANALRPVPGGWDGDLFDGEGFALGLEGRGFRVAGKRCAVVGAGGAGAAISLALAEREAASIAVWDLDTHKAQGLAARLASLTVAPVQVAKPDARTDLAVNATPLGMQPGDPVPIDVSSLSAGTLVAEAIMKPPLTRLLAAAVARGCAVQEGRHMLDNQVEAIWTFFGLP